MKLPFKQQVDIPIYEATLLICVAKDIYSERKKLKQLFGNPPDKNDYNALSSYNGRGHFGLFFQPSALTTAIISHEVFHVTHRILDWSGVRFDKDTHEAAALLNGYLMDIVIKILPKSK